VDDVRAAQRLARFIASTLRWGRDVDWIKLREAARSIDDARAGVMRRRAAVVDALNQHQLEIRRFVGPAGRHVVGSMRRRRHASGGS
jgi:hypothetical protein